MCGPCTQHLLNAPSLLAPMVGTLQLLTANNNTVRALCAGSQPESPCLGAGILVRGRQAPE